MSAPTVDRDAQILLPFAERDYVDVRRTARILGVHPSTVYRLAATPRSGGGQLIDLVEYRAHARKRVLYASIMRFCDDLRARHLIRDRRPRLDNPLFRHRDEDLLPFPLTDTISLGDACRILGYEKGDAVLKLIDEGLFDAYQFIENAPWCISKSSLAAFIERARGRPAHAGVPYRAALRSVEERSADSPPFPIS